MCLTVRTCCRKANITGGKFESKFDGTAATAVLVSAVLSGVLAIGGSALRTSARYSWLLRRLPRPSYRIIVSPRAGPTLTMESFAPASSEMYLTYFLAAEGSCENLRAVCMDVFQPATSSYTGSQFAS